MDQALDLMRRLPPDNVQENLSSLVDLAPELTEELLCRVDQPLQVTYPSLVSILVDLDDIVHGVYNYVFP